MNPWPADKVERWPIERLIPYARNSRTHSDEQIGQIAASIREWGWTNPILVTEAGTIVAGHCRVLGARKLGIKEVPVMVAEGWTDAQVRAYALACRRNAARPASGWRATLPPTIAAGRGCQRPKGPARATLTAPGVRGRRTEVGDVWASKRERDEPARARFCSLLQHENSN